MARVEGPGHEQAIDEILNDNYTLSQICVAKFRVLRSAIGLFRLSVLCWLGMMVLLNTKVLFRWATTRRPESPRPRHRATGRRT